MALLLASTASQVAVVFLALVGSASSVLMGESDHIFGYESGHQLVLIFCRTLLLLCPVSRISKALMQCVCLPQDLSLSLIHAQLSKVCLNLQVRHVQLELFI